MHFPVATSDINFLRIRGLEQRKRITILTTTKYKVRVSIATTRKIKNYFLSDI
jgi:hypothetical protein